MAFYSFSIVGINKYELHQLKADSSQETVLGLSTYTKLCCLGNVTDENRLVAHIVGDRCSDGRKLKYAFAVIEENPSSSADKIAIQHALYYLNSTM